MKALFNSTVWCSKVLLLIFVLAYLQPLYANTGTQVTPLSGSYTLGVGGDYISFSEVIDALEQQGVSGPVTLHVLTGTYQLNQPITVGEIPGASETNRVTIQSQTGKKSDVVLQHNSTVWNFTGGDYVTVKNLTMRSGGTVVATNSRSKHLRFIADSVMSTSTFQSAVYLLGDSVTIDKSYVSGGRSAIYLFFNKAVVLTNSILENSVNEALYAQGTEDLSVLHNTLIASGTNAFPAINFNAPEGLFHFINNLVISDKSTVAVRFQNGSGTNLITNNLYFVKNATDGYLNWDGTIYTDINALQTATGLHESSAFVPFDPIDRTSYKLISAAYDDFGVSVSEIPTDYFNVVRAGQPDVGAVESTVALNAVAELLSPADGSVLLGGFQQSIAWQSSDPSPLSLEYSTNSVDWVGIETGLNAIGDVVWTVPVLEAFTTQALYLRASNATGSTKHTLSVKTPELRFKNLPAPGQFRAYRNFSEVIQFELGNMEGAQTYVLSYQLSDQDDWVTVASNPLNVFNPNGYNSGSYFWTPPNESTQVGRLAISLLNAPGVADTIALQIQDPTLQLTSPQEGTSLFVGGSTTFTWEATGYSPVGGFNLYYRKGNEAAVFVSSVQNTGYTWGIPESLLPGQDYAWIVSAASDATIADTLAIELVAKPGFSGTFTLGSPGFETLQKVADTLSMVNLTGPVIFELPAGNYQTGIELSQISGLSAINSLSFVGLGPRESVVLESSNNGQSITFKDVGHIQFENLQIGKDYTEGDIVAFLGTNEAINFRDCYFKSFEYSRLFNYGGTDQSGVEFFEGTWVDSEVINSVFDDGNSITFNGTLLVQNNQFINQQPNCYECGDQRGVVIGGGVIFKGNTISITATEFERGGNALVVLDENYSGKAIVAQNQISTSFGSAVYVEGIDSLLLYNNFLSSSNLQSDPVLYITGAAYLDALFNTVEAVSSAYATSSVYISNYNEPARVSFINNLIVNNYNGSALEIELGSNAYQNSQFNNNNFYSATGSAIFLSYEDENFNYFQNTYEDVAAFDQAFAPAGENLNEPILLNATYAINNPNLEGAGLDVSLSPNSLYFDQDLDGETRNLAQPDIGADAFATTFMLSFQGISLGDTLYIGETVPLGWQTSAPGPFDLSLSLDSGITWEPVLNGTPSFAYSWSVPVIDTSTVIKEALIRLDASGQSVLSEAFTIIRPIIELDQALQDTVFYLDQRVLLGWSEINLPASNQNEVFFKFRTADGAEEVAIDQTSSPTEGEVFWRVPDNLPTGVNHQLIAYWTQNDQVADTVSFSLQESSAGDRPETARVLDLAASGAITDAFDITGDNLVFLDNYGLNGSRFSDRVNNALDIFWTFTVPPNAGEIEFSFCPTNVADNSLDYIFDASAYLLTSNLQLAATTSEGCNDKPRIKATDLIEGETYFLLLESRDLAHAEGAINLEVTWSKIKDLGNEEISLCGFENLVGPTSANQAAYTWEKDGETLTNEIGPSLDIFEPGTYRASVFSSDTLRIKTFTVLEDIAVTQRIAKASCSGSLLLDVSGNDQANYRWIKSLNNDLSLLEESGPELQANESAAYTAYISTASACTSVRFEVGISSGESLPEESFRVSLFPGLATTLDIGYLQDVLTTTWSSNVEGFSPPELSNATSVEVSQPGAYKVLAQGLFGCLVIDYDVFNALDDPNLSVVIDSIPYRDGFSFDLDPGVTTPGASFLWSDGSTAAVNTLTSAAQLANDGFYVDYALPNVGAQRIIYRVKEPVSLQPIVKNACDLTNVGLMLDAAESFNPTTPSDQFLWADDGSNAKVRSVNAPGSYTVYMNGDFGIVSRTFEVVDQPGVDQLFLKYNGVEFDLEAAYFASTTKTLSGFEWQDALGNTLSTADAFTIATAGTYRLQLSYDDGQCVVKEFTIADGVQDFLTREIKLTSGVPFVLDPGNFFDLSVLPAGPISYQWTNSNPGNELIINGQEASFTFNGPDQVILAITGNNTGTLGISFDLIEGSEVLASRVAYYNASNSAQLSLTDALPQTEAVLSYQWRDSVGTILSGNENYATATSGDLTGFVTSTAGTYQVAYEVSEISSGNSQENPFSLDDFESEDTEVDQFNEENFNSFPITPIYYAFTVSENSPIEVVDISFTAKGTSKATILGLDEVIGPDFQSRILVPNTYTIRVEPDPTLSYADGDFSLSVVKKELDLNLPTVLTECGPEAEKPTLSPDPDTEVLGVDQLSYTYTLYDEEAVLVDGRLQGTLLETGTGPGFQPAALGYAEVLAAFPGSAQETRAFVKIEAFRVQNGVQGFPLTVREDKQITLILPETRERGLTVQWRISRSAQAGPDYNSWEQNFTASNVINRSFDPGTYKAIAWIAPAGSTCIPSELQAPLTFTVTPSPPPNPQDGSGGASEPDGQGDRGSDSGDPDDQDPLECLQRLLQGEECEIGGGGSGSGGGGGSPGPGPEDKCQNEEIDLELVYAPKYLKEAGSLSEDQQLWSTLGIEAPVKRAYQAEIQSILARLEILPGNPPSIDQDDPVAQLKLLKELSSWLANDTYDLEVNVLSLNVEEVSATTVALAAHMVFHPTMISQPADKRWLVIDYQPNGDAIPAGQPITIVNGASPTISFEENACEEQYKLLIPLFTVPPSCADKKESVFVGTPLSVKYGKALGNQFLIFKLEE